MKAGTQLSPEERRVSRRLLAKLLIIKLPSVAFSTRGLSISDTSSIPLRGEDAQTARQPQRPQKACTQAATDEICRNGARRRRRASHFAVGLAVKKLRVVPQQLCKVNVLTALPGTGGSAAPIINGSCDFFARLAVGAFPRPTRDAPVTWTEADID